MFPRPFPRPDQTSVTTLLYSGLVAARQVRRMHPHPALKRHNLDTPERSHWIFSC